MSDNRQASGDTATDGKAVTTFSCEACGLRKVARVRLAPGVQGPDEVLAWVECPRCGHVGRTFRPIRSARLVLLGLLVAIGSCVELLDDGGVVWVGGVCAGLALMGFLFWKGLDAAWILKRAAVELTDDPVPLAQLAGATCAECSKRIVTGDSGVSCPDCGVPLHHTVCVSRHASGAHAGSPVDGAPYRASSIERGA